MQISLFNENIYYEFDGSFQTNSNNSIVDKNGIVRFNFDIVLSTEETMQLIAKSHKQEMFDYGWKIWYYEENQNKEIYLRFGNLTTSKRETISEFVNRGFAHVKEKGWNIEL